LLVVAKCVPVDAATNYYVSATTGNDAWSGTLAAPNSKNADGPFKTLNKAKAAMEGSSIKTAIIESGTYSIAGSNLLFSWADSGQSWMPQQGARVTIDGSGSGYISARGATGLTVEGLTIQNVGEGPSGAGFYLNGSSYTIRWNTFLNCFVNCISGSNVQSSYIDSNTMNGQSPGNPPNNTGQAFSAISLWYASSNNFITHNLIENTEGGGIDLDDGPSDPTINNNTIDRNLLESINTNVVDMGALYIYDETGSSTGNQITNNRVVGGGNPISSTKCIYLDGSASNVLVKGNVCAHQGGGQPDEYSVFIHGGKNNNVTNNILEAQRLPTFTDYWGNSAQNGGYLGAVQSDTGVTDGSGNIFTHNIVFAPGSWPGVLWQIMPSTYTKPSAWANVYYSMTGAAVSSYEVPDASPFSDNPLFANPSADDYRVGMGSAVFTDIAWQTLPIDQGPVANPFLTSTHRIHW
jgi:parallel beta-helix repeat protein